MLLARQLLVLSAVVVMSTSLLAQRKPGGTIPAPGVSRDTHLEIQLVTEQGRNVQRQALVEVMSMGGVNVRGYTSLEGRISFSVRQGQNYNITVSGSDIATAASSFEVLSGESYHREQVTVALKEPEGAAAPGSVVSASELNIPEKARREFEKGAKEFHKKKWDKAREHFEKAVREYPQFDLAHNNIGVTALQQGDIPRAREAFAKAIEINERNPAASRNLGRICLMQDKNLPRAKELLQKSLAVEPANGETLTLLSFTQMQTGELDSALVNAKKVHASAPQDQFPFAHLIAARVLEEKGQKAAAAQEYRAYLKEAEGTPAAQKARDGLARLGEKF